MKRWKVDHAFAWFPVLIRNKGYGLVGRMSERWVWLKRYTRVWRWSYPLNRYRTHDTVLGHINYPTTDEEI